MKNYLEKFIRFVDSTDLSRYSLVSYACQVPETSITSILKSRYNDKFLFYWNKRSESLESIGLEAAIQIEEDGWNRTINSEFQINALQSNFFSNWNEFNLKSAPLFFGGMKFAPNGHDSIWEDYHDSNWVVPKFVFFNLKDDHYLIFNFSPQNSKADLISEFERGLAINFESNNKVRNDYLGEYEYSITETIDFPNWKEKVLEILDKIRERRFQKVVLSRFAKINAKDKLPIPEFVDELKNRYPDCYIFAFKSNESIFFGASPEKLTRISEGYIEADALAGSNPRGKDSIEDDRLGNELIQSKKNREEHNAVVEFILDAFAELTDNVEYDQQPILKKLPNIQHLWTPIRAKLNTNKSIFSLIKQIHPTPAICGVPWSGAQKFIIELEGYDRGLYSGVIGWFNFYNEGEFTVAIRSALYQENSLYAFAGCGIVEGSDPMMEYEETELKLKPILSLLKYEKASQS
ncbi:MAG: isochorismate synthase [Melioribacteraceae bacterium]|nr:isochorismate synthase [Melioribacteraceae bacterium]MCF8354820.1 isochorismate synthase [Melioribacteraceae bacterium]MCF8394549.1 isochorismate synthase [Melioribacteraceae bacterium]MCF8420208.1 isochorismate synthase [Melioribacteraceae bacterium]